MQFQPKAWYDSATCNKYCVEVAVDEIKKESLPAGKRAFLACDNLFGQTKKSNPQFTKLLDRLCGCDVWNLLAGNTDEIQVVDDGVGAQIKFEHDDIHTAWLKVAHASL